MASVWLVEDDDELRGSLARALTSFDDVNLTGCFRAPSECLGAVDRGERFDVGLIDLGLPETSGASLIATLLRRFPDAALIALTVRSDDESLFGALRAGAVGYLLKDTSPAELESAVALAKAGGSPLSPSIGRRVVRALGGGTRNPRDLGLTPREAEVLEILCSGASYREVGRAMGIAESTVQTHVKSIYEKLGAKSKAEAVRIALDGGRIRFRSD